jgi:hypothetical protein
VPVQITDAQGHTVLETRSDGPFLLVKLATEYYTVTAAHQGQRLTKTVHITPAKAAHLLFLWVA